MVSYPKVLWKLLALARGDGIIRRVTPKTPRPFRLNDLSAFQRPEELEFEEWYLPDPDHMVLHTRHEKDPDWAITAFFEVQSGGAVLSGLLVRPAGGWSPPGGLTSDIVRGINLSTLRKRSLRRVRYLETPPYLGVDLVSHSDRRPGERKRPGRRGRTDLDYARLASRYVDLLDDPTPIKLMASQDDLSEITIRGLLYEARKRGLLTSATPGQAGGKLTDKAVRLLSPAGDEV